MDAGETVQDQLDKYPSDIFSRVEVADGRAWMLPNGTEFFAGDLSEKEQKLVWATHYAPVFDLFHQQKLDADSIAWKSKPSWYVLATQDHTVHPDLQRWVSKRMGATITEVASSHVPMLSQPDVVIDVIRKARPLFKTADDCGYGRRRKGDSIRWMLRDFRRWTNGSVSSGVSGSRSWARWRRRSRGANGSGVAHQWRDGPGGVLS